jgi:hypothetical protein
VPHCDLICVSANMLHSDRCVLANARAALLTPVLLGYCLQHYGFTYAYAMHDAFAVAAAGSITREVQEGEPSQHGWATPQHRLLHDGSVLVPADVQLREEIIYEAHDAAAAGRFAEKATLKRLEGKYFWQHGNFNMRAHVTELYTPAMLVSETRHSIRNLAGCCRQCRCLSALSRVSV